MTEAAGGSFKAVLVPGVLALLPRYGSLHDPVPELREACGQEVEWLLEEPGPVTVLADEQGLSVAHHLLGQGVQIAPGSGRVLVVGNGSARRTTASPGPYDDRAVGFDDHLGAALAGPDPAALAGLDPDLCSELWARVGGIPALGALLTGQETTVVDLEAAPYGVQWWVARWQR